MQHDDTITAIASASGRSARGVIRFSGPRTFELLLPLLTFVDDDAPVRTNVSRGVYRARLTLGDRPAILPVLVLAFPGPASYTGEDSLELQCPGNPVLLGRIVDDILVRAQNGRIDIRRAEPGEFSARAFMGGRISLTQAEGVCAAISARSDAQLRAAHQLLGGDLGDLARSMADELAIVLALVEAGIDFTDEEDVVAIAPDALHERLTALHETIAGAVSRSVGAEDLDALPWVVLTGPPNAGKSSLFNALLGRQRAVVSDVAGTTRDVLAEPLLLRDPGGDASRDIEIMLVDIAGEEDGGAASMTRQMQQQAAAARERADLILHCTPADSPSTSPGETPKGENVVLVRTKMDLLKTDQITEECDIAISAYNDRLYAEMAIVLSGKLADRGVALGADMLALRPRHEAALRGAMDAIADAIALNEPYRTQRSSGDIELLAGTLRVGLDELCELAGAITPDDVLGRIFSSFCVGK